MHVFASGDRIVLTTRVGRKTLELLGVFQGLQTKSRAVVWVDPVKMDEDGMRLADVRSLKPFYNHPTDQQRRARHTARLYKQGVRAFRLNAPTGRSFFVETLDIENGIAVGRQVQRKTVQIVPLHSLWPELQ